MRHWFRVEIDDSVGALETSGNVDFPRAIAMLEAAKVNLILGASGGRPPIATPSADGSPSPRVAARVVGFDVTKVA